MSATILHLDKPQIKLDLEQIDGPDALILLSIMDDRDSVLIGVRPRDLARLSHALGFASEQIHHHIAQRLQKALDETAVNRSGSEQISDEPRD